MKDIYNYTLKENERINSKTISKICTELKIEKGLLIITRARADKKERRVYVIDGRYKIPVYSNKYGSRTLFR